MLYLRPGLGLGAVTLAGEVVMDATESDASLPAWARDLHSGRLPLDASMRLVPQGTWPSFSIRKSFHLMC